MKGALLVAALAVAVALATRIATPARPDGGADGKIGNPSLGTKPGNVGHGTPLVPSAEHQLAAFAQGCFWGVEERFRRVPGVVATAVGYTGGRTQDPSYEEVSSQQLIEVFWRTPDPTSVDRQGPDRGSQYRSAIFTFGAEQQAIALASRDAEQARLADRITTEIAAAGPFWVAEDYHQQWDEKHGYRSCPAPHRPRST